MLNEKEKKAIERLKERINDNEDYKTVQVWLTADIVAVNTVLNLITKLQKENNLLNNYVKENEIYKKNLFNYAEKKDKQIDLMADEIIMTKPINCTKTNEFSTKKIYMSKEEIKQYFADLVEKEN